MLLHTFCFQFKQLQRLPMDIVQFTFNAVLYIYICIMRSGARDKKLNIICIYHLCLNYICFNWYRSGCEGVCPFEEATLAHYMHHITHTIK